MVLRVRSSPCWFPTSIPYILVFKNQECYASSWSLSCSPSRFEALPIKVKLLDASQTTPQRGNTHAFVGMEGANLLVLVSGWGDLKANLSLVA